MCSDCCTRKLPATGLRRMSRAPVASDPRCLLPSPSRVQRARHRDPRPSVRLLVHWNDALLPAGRTLLGKHVIVFMFFVVFVFFFPFGRRTCASGPPIHFVSNIAIYVGLGQCLQGRGHPSPSWLSVGRSVGDIFNERAMTPHVMPFWWCSFDPCVLPLET